MTRNAKTAHTLGDWKPKAKRGGTLSFFKEFFRSPKELGTFLSSSPVLARAIVKPLLPVLQNAGVVVEYGPGTGPVTKELFRHMREDAVFMAIERNEALAGEFQRRFPGVDLAVGDATEVESIAGERGIEAGSVDAIASGVPFMLLEPGAQEDILRASHRMLRPGGVMTILSTRPPGFRGVRRFREMLRDVFGNARLLKPVLASFPPAWIYVVSKAPAGTAAGSNGKAG